MKRENRLLQIEMRKRDVSRRLFLALESSQKPLAFFKKYPAASMTVTALVLGILTRGVIARPLPAALKLMTIPLFRTALTHVFISYRKSKRIQKNH
jgi:hypothetical protein